MKKSILIEGMSCGHCVQAVTEAIMAVAGVEKVNVNLDEKKAEVDYQEEKVKVEELYQAIEDVGFEVLK